MEKYIIDRFEEDFAVLEMETGGTIDVPKSEIPDGKEGDVVILENGVYQVDEAETQKRKEMIKQKLSELFKKR